MPHVHGLKIQVSGDMNSHERTPLNKGCTRVSLRTSIVKNICSQICRRSQGSFPHSGCDISRINLSILSKLVCEKNSLFHNVWTKHSKSAINYAKGRIYFDNFRCCYNSLAAKPQQVYKMPACPKVEKIEDALLCESPVGESFTQPSEYTPSLIAVTGHNWLLRISANTGDVIDKVYLGSYRKFRYITWDVPQETFVLKSLHKKTVVEPQEQIDSGGSVLIYLAVFRVLPFALVGVLEIDKKIFGANVTDAMICQGILIVMHSIGLVRLYSFERLSEQFMKQKLVIGQTCIWKGETRTVGEPPFGIPCNITLTGHCCKLQGYSKHKIILAILTSLNIKKRKKVLLPPWCSTTDVTTPHWRKIREERPEARTWAAWWVEPFCHWMPGASMLCMMMSEIHYE
ncbi:DDB1- and CUL4-associated factor 17 [Pelobates cultripes]|uniref:DDB1- and CUL4-associated factor 17 n=1 Tax=Pelobates cultripes TaxID=61616 RepID=A0AAD1SRH9_PELCU|nr:DDB1- and CUL4-associated factor 17 [Pelobates cultripes]